MPLCSQVRQCCNSAGSRRDRRFTFAWQNQGVSQARELLDSKALKNGKVEVKVPLDSGTKPGVKGQLRFVVSAWNAET
ncbi:hypothetical protein D3880_09615 [Pseudomonas cavernae]|uniref:Uncharacterized protein n=1 Tax=Pseudomonas cavernae TaxID=2320867 RepID=A0A385Z3B0_9PSED|nr:hypothetical protein [Pseudomonas cavernae]AYC32627.1 hypothetical protein D3880_09615 [Pseudomonas cavernae]